MTTKALSTYDQLDMYCHAFARGHLNLVWLVGPPGVQKSRGLKMALSGDGHWINGSVTAFGLYRELWEHRNMLTVIDDVDDIYRNRDAVNLLKALCQTDPRKTLGWHSDNATLRREKIPRRFQTSSKVFVISNEVNSSNTNVLALQDRGHMLHFNPPPLEVHKRTAMWFYDEDIFGFIGRRLQWIEQPSMRDYVLAAELKASDLDWKNFLYARWGITGNRLLVVQLQEKKELHLVERLQMWREATDEPDEVYFEEAHKLGYRRRTHA